VIYAPSRTAILVVFTAALIAIAIETAYLAWVLLERAR
jgi:hypothetical protein